MGVCEQCGQVAPPRKELQSAQEVEAEIAGIELLMEQLEQRRLELRRKANTLLPISHLPADVLLDIFAYVCKHDVEPPSLKQHGTYQPYTPLLLGSICAYWRTLLWNTPLAWREIIMNVSFTQPSSQLQLLVEWLGRAQKVPLHITLSAHCDSIDDMAFTQTSAAVLEVLATRSEHWKRVDFLIPTRCFDILQRNHFPSLTSFRLRPPPGSIAAFNPPPHIFISNTPSVVDLDLTGYDYSSMKLPWGQLQSFRAQFLSASQCLDVLRHSPNLIELHVDKMFIQDRHRVVQPLPDEFDHDSPLVHVNLQVLELGFIRAGALKELLDDLSLPALRELSISFSGANYWQSLAPLKTLALSSLSPSIPWGLRKLQVVQNPLDEEGLEACLEVLPALIELDIQVIGEPTERLDSLEAMRNQLGGLSKRLVRALNASQASGGATVLPLLRHFTYEGPVLCSLMNVVGMLSSRVSKDAGVTSLASAVVIARQSLTQAEILSKEDEMGIKALGELGIRVTQERNHKFW